MGMYHSTYFAYGARIPDTDGDALEAALKDQPAEDRVSYLHAGDYDRDMTFLVTSCWEVDLGESQVVDPQTATPEKYALWDGRIREIADALGVDPLHEPGWLVVPDLS